MWPANRRSVVFVFINDIFLRVIVERRVVIGIVIAVVVLVLFVRIGIFFVVDLKAFLPRGQDSILLRLRRLGSHHDPCGAAPRL